MLLGQHRGKINNACWDRSHGVPWTPPDMGPPRHGTGIPPDMELGPLPLGHGTGTPLLLDMGLEPPPPQMREMKWRIWKTDNKVVKNCNLN